MEYKLDSFNQDDKAWLISLKRKMAIDQSAVERLWEIHLKLLGKYPNHNKANACGRCIVEVLDECVNKANDFIFPVEIEVEEKKINGTRKQKGDL